MKLQYLVIEVIRGTARIFNVYYYYYIHILVNEYFESVIAQHLAKQPLVVVVGRLHFIYACQQNSFNRSVFHSYTRLKLPLLQSAI